VLGRSGKLSTGWRQPVTRALGPTVAGRVVWDLLPNEHRAAWQPDHLDLGKRITARFLDDVVKQGQRQLVTVSHWNKLLKGALVRHVVDHQVTELDQLSAFVHPEGYQYRADLSSDDGSQAEAVFVSRR
ncbi:MAG: peroxide stress protein YaaA, partial [Acidimicrobiales bacterium]